MAKDDEDLREEIRGHIKRRGYDDLKHIVEGIDPYCVFDGSNVTYALRFALYQLDKIEEAEMSRALNAMAGDT